MTRRHTPRDIPLDPREARWIVARICRSKAPRTIESALNEITHRLQRGDQKATVYRCMLSNPSRDVHYHLSSGDRPAPQSVLYARLFESLGDEAYRVNDEITPVPDTGRHRKKKVES